jgi:hypothetical protein
MNILNIHVTMKVFLKLFMFFLEIYLTAKTLPFAFSKTDFKLKKISTALKTTPMYLSAER